VQKLKIVNFDMGYFAGDILPDSKMKFVSNKLHDFILKKPFNKAYRENF
jgi:hypothetical protein